MSNTSSKRVRFAVLFLPQKRTISQRSIDVDKAVPQHMGISKAILENVIFVHQEDANWPLKESKVLVRQFCACPHDLQGVPRWNRVRALIWVYRTEREI